jgi:dihydroorotate dehydrogenase electron transfer subunit
MPNKVIIDLIVSKKTFLNDEYFTLDLDAGKPLPEIVPGQFAEVLIPGTFLRRPISIHDADYARGTVRFLVQIVGEGTRHLSEIRENENLDVVLPLGNGFKLPVKGDKVLLVGGGCGVAPLLFLARKCREAGAETDILVGVRSRDKLIETELYQKFGNLFITTEDGSEGVKGFVTHHPVFSDIKKYSAVYTCGPEVMMMAVAKRTASQGTECYVSLENMMACGIGACLCCVTDTQSGRKCVCTEGPVFNVKELTWQI